jgi:zinc transport system permease protein
MIRAFIVGIIIAVVAPFIGTFLVVRRYSLMADTLSHISFLGVAIGLYLKINPIITALVISLAASIGIEQLRTNRKIYGESALALFLTGSLALATIIIGLAQGFSVNLLSYLFGSITTVTLNDCYLIVGLGVLIIIATLFLYRSFFVVALDEELALISNVPVKIVNIILIMLAALTVSLSLRIVGVLLIGALMVIPVISAMRYNRSFKQTIGISIIFSLASVISGLFLSYYIGLPSGGTIVATALVFFIISLFINR